MVRGLEAFVFERSLRGGTQARHRLFRAATRNHTGWCALLSQWMAETPRVAVPCLAALCLTACAHTPQGPTHFPDPPDSLEAPLHVDATLKPGATLADVLRAHLAEAQARETAEARLKIWLAWYSKQAALWSGKGLDPR